MKIIALNVGNSMIGAARTDGRSVETRIAVTVHDKAALAGLDGELRRMGGGDLPVAAASVNALLLEEVEDLLSFPLLLAGRDFPLPLPNRCRQSERTGHDRLLDGYAAGILYGLPVIAVDFGTALTFNLVDGEGAFLGGAILPGPGLASRTLGSGCEQLPSIDLSALPDFALAGAPVTGRDTEEAILSGLLHGYLGLVDYMIAIFRTELGGSCRAVATGGEASLIAPRATGIDFHDRDLILKGIALAYDAARSP